MRDLGNFLSSAWDNYLDTTPQAMQIVRRFGEQGEKIINDHIALRTLSHASCGIETLSAQFEAMGLTRALASKDEYHFSEKKLRATYFHHPTDSSIPKIFVSELLFKQLPGPVQETCEFMLSKLPRSIQVMDFTQNWRPWDIHKAQYHRLAKFSEYAAWVYALGFRVNHFTVSVNHLKKATSVELVNKWIKEWGFSLNEEGGAIKGTPLQGLVQSSTLADRMTLHFKEGQETVPTCYFEFAQRFELGGRLYQGFIPSSADKIFESTKR